MSYGVKYHCDHKTSVKDTVTTARIEILEDGFVGESTKILGVRDGYRRELERLDKRKPFESPIQKSRLEFYPIIQDEDDLAILTDIFEGAPNKYLLRQKINGSVVCTTKVQPGLLEYPGSGYPFAGKIIGKDLSSLDSPSSSFGLQTGSETIIQTIADILSNLGYGLDIHTHTNWEYADASGDDYLNKISHVLQNLREFGNAGEDDTPITDMEALLRILRANELILRQAGGVWNLYHISALKNPTSVTRYVYDSTGSQTSSGTVDLTQSLSGSSIYVLPGSNNFVIPALKQVKSRFNHRTKLGSITVPERITLDNTEDAEYTQELFLSDGNQQIEIEGFSRIFESDNGTEVSVDITIQADDYYFTGEQWSQTPSTVTLETDPAESGQWITGVFSITTPPTPIDADGTLRITFHRGWVISAATPGGDYADETWWRNLHFNILNPTVEEGSVAIVNKLYQSTDWREEYDHGDVYFGDGPAPYSPSRLGYVGGRTDGKWRFVGETDEWDFHQLGLKEILCWQRTPVLNNQADLYGQYEPTAVPDYRSSYYFFLGGTQSGKDNRWDAQLATLQFADTADTFERHFQTDGGGSGTGSSGTSSTSTVGWNDILSKPFKTIGENLEVDSDALKVIDEPDFLSLSINGSPFVDQNRDVTGRNADMEGWIAAAGNITAYSDGGGQSIQEQNYNVNQLSVNQLVYTGGTGGVDLFVNDLINENLLPSGGGGGGAVDSVFGRTGAVTAQSGDYSIGQISGANATDWDTAYGWGNHASAGYASHSAVSGRGLFSSTSSRENAPLNADDLDQSGFYRPPGSSSLGYANNFRPLIVSAQSGGNNDGFITIIQGGDGDNDLYFSNRFGDQSPLWRRVVTTTGSWTFSGDVNAANLEIANWNTAYNWGDHAGAGYGLLSATQTWTGNNTFNSFFRVDYDGTGSFYLSIDGAGNLLQYRTNSSGGLNLKTDGTWSGDGGYIAFRPRDVEAMRVHGDGGASFYKTVRGESGKSDTANVGTVFPSTANFEGHSGYWGFRTSTSNDFSLDVYGGGTPKSAIEVTQVGDTYIKNNLICETGLVLPDTWAT